MASRNGSAGGHDRLHRVCERDRWRCRYCDHQLFCYVCHPEQKGRGLQATRDHLVPIARGGAPKALSNQVAACDRCNFAKGEMTEAEFLASDTAPRPAGCRVRSMLRRRELAHRLVVPPHILDSLDPDYLARVAVST